MYGTISPTGKVKQRIIISAHHDSAHIFNFLEKNPLLFNPLVRAGLYTIGTLFLTSWVLVFFHYFDALNPTLQNFISGFFLASGIMVAPMYFFYNSKKGTPGAGDNMICTAVAMEIGKYFSKLKEKNIPLKHTQIVVASWDAEECGLRGSRAYCKENQAELSNIKTYNFNLECLYDHKELNFLTSDLNNFIQLSEGMVKDGIEIAKNLGFGIKTKSFPLLAGGTDAAEFSKIGVEATTLAAMSWEKRKVDSPYHTTRDTIYAVDSEAVKMSIEIGIGYILKMDERMTTTLSD